MTESDRIAYEEETENSPSFPLFLLCIIFGAVVWLVPLYWAETIGYGWSFAIIAFIITCLFIMVDTNTKEESSQIDEKANQSI